ncbi:hypothetical protein COP2_014140 [Malus domestica]
MPITGIANLVFLKYKVGNARVQGRVEGRWAEDRDELRTRGCNRKFWKFQNLNFTVQPKEVTIEKRFSPDLFHQGHRIK